MIKKLRLLFTKDRRSGKLRFKLRTINNFALAIVIFLLCALLLVYVWSDKMAWAWLADGILVALLFYIYRVFWNKRAIWIRCPSCMNKVATNTPWVCGACEKKNEHVDDFPFVNRCEFCGVEPKAYQCHHKDCGKLIFLTADESLRNYAYCLNPPYASEEGRGDRVAYEKEKRWREYKISLTRLDTEMEQVKQEFEAMTEKKKPTAPMTPEEKVEASWAKRKSQTITAAEIYRREKKANAEKYKDDPEMHKKADEALDDWYEGGSWEHIV